MSGRLHPLPHRSNSTQPTDHGSLRNIDDSSVTPTVRKPSPPPPFPFTINAPHSQPTGALHPATLTPVSAVPSSRYYYPQPGISQYQPTTSTSPKHSPTRPNISRHSSSAGLQGLAEAAMMEEAQGGAPGGMMGRTLPPPVGFRPAYASHGRFWDDKLSHTRTKAESTLPSPKASQPPSSARPTATPSTTPPPTSANPYILPSPIRRSSHTITSAPAPALPIPAKPPAARKRPIPKGPHPLADMDLDKEYNPPTVEEWEQRALRVMHLPAIPATWHPKPPAPASSTATSNPTPPMTALPNTRTSTPPITSKATPATSGTSGTSENPPTPPVSSTVLPSDATAGQSPSAKSSRPKRGGDRKPRATPHCASTKPSAIIATHDPTGRRIHPPPAGPLSNGLRSDRDTSADLASPDMRTSISDPGPINHSLLPQKPPYSRSSSFEAHATHRRASVRSQHHSGSESISSSGSSRSSDGGVPGSGRMEKHDTQTTFVGSQDSGDVEMKGDESTGGTVEGGRGSTGHRRSKRKSSSARPTQAEYDVAVKLNFQLQVQAQEERTKFQEAMVEKDQRMAQKDQRIRELEAALEQAKAASTTT